MGEMSILNHEGDTKVIWDPENEDECDAAEEQFAILMEKGFTAFEVSKRGKKTAKVVKKFDPELGKLIMVPQLQGG